MKEVRIIKESKIDLNLLGKIVNVEDLGEGIVVGYSSITGEPFGYFYNIQGNKVICFSHKEVIGGVGSRVRRCKNGAMAIY